MRHASEKTWTDFLTWLEASAEYHISVTSLKCMARAGKLKRYKMPGLRETLLSREELSQVMKPQPIGA
jgi:hypothetical protein